MRDKTVKKRIISYLLLIVFFAVLQSAPRLNLALWGITPIFLISLTVCKGMFEKEVIGGYLGLFAGMCWDLTSSKVVGFYSVFLLIVGVVCGLLITNFMQNNLMTLTILAGGALALYGIIDYIGIEFNYGLSAALHSLIHSIIPQVLYSFVFVIPIYLFCRFLLKKIRQKEQLN